MSDTRASEGRAEVERTAAGRADEPSMPARPRPDLHRLNPAAIAAGVRRALAVEGRYGHGFLWIPVAMAAGAATWFGLDRDIALWPVILLFACLAGGCLFLAGAPAWRFLLILACGFLVGVMAAAVETHRHATILLDGPVTTRIEGIVASRDVDDRGRWRYTVRLTGTDDPEIGRPPERVRLLARSRHDPVGVGWGISGLARLQPPSGPALPGAYDFAFNAYFQGLGAYGFFMGRPEHAGADDPGVKTDLAATLARFREQIAFRIRDVLPGDAGAFASALTVADRRAMSPAAVEALRGSGLAHVLAISGLHMALVAGTVFFALRTGLSLFPTVAQAFPVKKLAALISLLVATAYLLISGGSVSTQRAWLMLAIVLIAVMVDRPALTLRNVALAAIGIILLSPSAVVGPGFQMSFAATAALVAAYAGWRQRGRAAQGSGRASTGGWVGLVLTFFIGLAVTSLVAGLATAPFAVHHFHRVAAYGLLANLAAMPIVTLVVMPAGLVSVLAMPLGLEFWPLQLMGVGLDGVLFVARTVQELGGHVTIGRLPDVAFVLMIAGFLILVLMRSWLRLVGLPVIAVALAAFFVLPARGDPELLISEDGRLVALVDAESLATNRSRPSTFLFDQWRRALRRNAHVKPDGIAVEGEGAAIPASIWTFGQRGSGEAVPFRCVKDAICVGQTGSGVIIALVDDLALLGTACDRAGIVITHRAIAMPACRSGALLITGRMLRQTGGVEIYPSDTGDEPRIVTALGQSERPWTVHRSYDWRRRSFGFDRPDWAKP